MAKRFKLKEGDIYTIPLEEGVFGLGQVICFPKTSDAFITVIFDIKIKDEKELELLNISELKILFLGYTFDAKLYHNDWKIIGNYKSNISLIPLPYFKLGTKDDARLVNYKSEVLKGITEEQFDKLYYKTEIAPIRYENALKAYYGLKEWVGEDYDKLLYLRTIESIKIAEEILNS